MAEQERRGVLKPRRKKRRICIFCADKVVVDYKNLDLMSRFVTQRGKIMPRRSSGNCALHQRKVARAISRCRQVGLLPFVVD